MRQTPRHLGAWQPSPQRGGWDRAKTQGPGSSGRVGNRDHPHNGDLGGSAGVHKTRAGAGPGSDTGSATDKSGCVPSSRPHGESVEEEDPGALEAGLKPTLADLVARFPSTASTDSNLQGGSEATATGHEHDPKSTVGVVHGSVVPTRGQNDRKRAAERSQQNRLGDSRRDGSTPPARGKNDT